MLSHEEIEQFSKLPTGNVCDANNKSGNMDFQIKPIDKNSKLAGPAVTVRCNPGDNLILHQAIYKAEPGSVLVIDSHGYTGAGAMGEIMATACQARGIAGIVIDGTCRDANDIEELGFPFFCRGFNPGGTVKESWGTINETIQCGGVVVNPGDIIVGDVDGVVVVSKDKASEVLSKAKAIAEKETKVKEMLRQGKITLEIYGFDKLIEQKGYK
ncbi:MAG: 4-carboxy-4-hydroxy-2-oxoadipate aldolase/oxaloacetate decarboxylase [Clostridiaceae bacterium]|nr:4-carboxy-4-hydroxy-2-oxoadipate aldolase/oxaloacetate decarboxylase [Clostridiaceae bacterium]